MVTLKLQPGSSLPPSLPCYFCSFLLVNIYVLSAVLTVTCWLWSVLWGTTECCDCIGDNQIQPASTFSWTLTNAERKYIRERKKTLKNLWQFLNFLSCVWLTTLTLREVLSTTNPQTCAVLEMLNCVGKTSQC